VPAALWSHASGCSEPVQRRARAAEIRTVCSKSLGFLGGPIFAAFLLFCRNWPTTNFFRHSFVLSFQAFISPAQQESELRGGRKNNTYTHRSMAAIDGHTIRAHFSRTSAPQAPGQNRPRHSHTIPSRPFGYRSFFLPTLSPKIRPHTVGRRLSPARAAAPSQSSPVGPIWSVLREAAGQNALESGALAPTDRRDTVAAGPCSPLGQTGATLAGRRLSVARISPVHWGQSRAQEALVRRTLSLV